MIEPGPEKVFFSEKEQRFYMHKHHKNINLSYSIFCVFMVNYQALRETTVGSGTVDRSHPLSGAPAPTHRDKGIMRFFSRAGMLALKNMSLVAAS